MSRRNIHLPSRPTLSYVDCACGKRGYKHSSHAVWTMERMQRLNHARMAPYRCPVSRLWHVGQPLESAQ